MPTNLTTNCVRLLLKAARGQYVPAASATLNSNHPPQASTPLRCFALRQEHIRSLSPHGKDPPSPRDFHSHLCRMIRGAKHRVQLASLYIGAASSADSKRERELLNALTKAASRPHVSVTILLDENRALRKIPRKQDNTVTSSADAVHECLESARLKSGTGSSAGSGLFLFQALNEVKSLLPSPLNEVAGVLHIKAYIVDDSLILSGANLSEEYFEDRQDRYMWFHQGGGGLVDFYSRLVDILCQYARPYRSSPKTTQAISKEQLLELLTNLLDGSNDDMGVDNDATVAYAVATFQAPMGFFGATPTFPSDAQVTRNLLLTALQEDPTSTVRLSSAYLNPTPSLMTVLARFGNTGAGATHLLTAGGSSHGFAPKTKMREGHGSAGRDWIPLVFEELTREAAQHISPNGGKVLMYERPGWTFHSKGLWLNMLDDSGTVRILDSQSLVASIVGSGNYGARSEKLDMESNCILVLPDGLSPLKESLAQEWNYMCSDFATEWDDGNQTRQPSENSLIPLAIPYIRNLF